MSITVDNGTLTYVPGVAARAAVKVDGDRATVVVLLNQAMQPHPAPGDQIAFLYATWVLDAPPRQTDAQTLTYTFHRRPNP